MIGAFFTEALQAAAATRSLRVALMNFASDDNSYRSTVAAIDFAVALQAQLSDAADFEWVERAELDKVETEFKLADLGFVDRAETIRRGRWAKADWAVTGRFSTDDSGQRTLTLEIIDLPRADLLDSVTIDLRSDGKAPLASAQAEIIPCAAKLKELLLTAKARYSAVLGKPTVALLFFCHDGSVYSTLKDLEERFRATLEAAATNRSFRLLHLRRAGDSIDEAGLTLTGLVETDPNAVSRVADYYVWGTYHADKGHEMDRELGRARDFLRLTLRLNVWDGSGEPIVITNVPINRVDGDAVATRLVETVVAHVRNQPLGDRSSAVRPATSETLLQQAASRMEVGMSSWMQSATQRRAWFDIVQMLEAACFIDPTSQKAREWWLRVRWGSDTGRSARNSFVFHRRRSEEWRRFIEQFGLQPATTFAPPNSQDDASAASNYVLAAARVFEIVCSDQQAQARMGVPRDTGGREIAEWRERLGAEFAQRLINAGARPELQRQLKWLVGLALGGQGQHFYIPDAALRLRLLNALGRDLARALAAAGEEMIDAALKERIRLTFLEAGQPSGADQLLGQISATLAGTPAAPKSRQVSLPRAHPLDNAEQGAIFALPVMDFSPLQVEAPLRAVPFATDQLFGTIQAMEFHDGRLWLSVRSHQVVRDAPELAAKANELAGAKSYVPRLWNSTPDYARLEISRGLLATNDIWDIISFRGRLWCATDQGVAEFDSVTSRVRWFAESQGLTGTNWTRMTACGNTLWVMSDRDQLSVLGENAVTWIPLTNDPVSLRGLTGDPRRMAGSGDWLLVFRGQLAGYNRRGDAWQRFDDRIGRESPQGMLGAVNCIEPDAPGSFWVGTTNGLHWIHPAGNEIVSQYLAPPISIRSFAPRPAWSDLVWTASYVPDPTNAVRALEERLRQRERFAALRRAGSRRLNAMPPTTRLTSPVTALARDGDFLWVATAEENDERPRGRLLLYHVPERKWVGRRDIPCGIQRMMATPEAVWVAGAYAHRVNCVRVDKAPWLNVPKSQWLPEEVTASELEKEFDALSPKQRAIYSLFAGRESDIPMLLTGEGPPAPDAESLFILAHAQDRHGLNDPQKQRHYEELVLREFPDGLFAQYLRVGRTQVVRK
jgi:hypothetical protein